MTSVTYAYHCNLTDKPHVLVVDFMRLNDHERAETGW